MRNISDNVVEKIKKKTLHIFNKFFPENRTVYEIMWKKAVERDRSQMKIWCMRIACWISKPTKTHTQAV